MSDTIHRRIADLIIRARQNWKPPVDMNDYGPSAGDLASEAMRIMGIPDDAQSSLIEHTCATGITRAEGEPVGPFAPTRDSAPKPKGSMVLGDIEWLTARFNSIESRLDGLGDVQKDAECTIDHEATSEHAFRSGKAIGRSEAEAELLNEGWTPPGAVHELEVSTGPTDYEVWRDALTLTGTNVFPIDGTGEAGAFDYDRKAQLRAEAEWWWGELQDVPVLRNDDGTDTTPVNPCPECRAGKHSNCPESVLDAADEMVPCPCPDTSHLF